jgi:hypothetical protein
MRVESPQPSLKKHLVTALAIAMAVCGSLVFQSIKPPNAGATSLWQVGCKTSGIKTRPFGGNDFKFSIKVRKGPNGIVPFSPYTDKTGYGRGAFSAWRLKSMQIVRQKLPGEVKFVYNWQQLGVNVPDINSFTVRFRSDKWFHDCWRSPFGFETWQPFFRELN